MRINLNLTPNKESLPYNYQTYLTGAIHKWLGLNDLHGKMALFSFSWLNGAYTNSESGLFFNQNIHWFISSYDNKMIKELIEGIQKAPAICKGIMVTEILFEETPNFTVRESFNTASPILCKRTLGNVEKHYLFSDNEWGLILTETLKHKMNIAGMTEDESLKIQLDLNGMLPQQKLIDYNGVKNKVSQCSVKIIGKPETKEFAWNVGLGNSTGIGFGSLI